MNFLIILYETVAQTMKELVFPLLAFTVNNFIWYSYGSVARAQFSLIKIGQNCLKIGENYLKRILNQIISLNDQIVSVE